MNDAFHGSYLPGDVTFLLDPIPVTGANVADLSLVSGGPIDYKTQITSESPFPPEYIDLFHGAVERNKLRLGVDVAQVALTLARRRKTEEIVIASLVRAGTPIGVLLHRALRELGVKNVHYSISATRKRGSDPSAIDHIVKHHDPASIVFVDGWTGKGYIAHELQAAITDYNATRGTNINSELVVLADLAGVSAVASSAEDYLIPAAMLRSTVCGLISASMLNPAGNGVRPDACLSYEFLAEHDLSRYFVASVMPSVSNALLQLRDQILPVWGDGERARVRAVSDRFVEDAMRAYGLTDRNKVKPGICEANRALLTRAVNMTLLVRDPEHDAADLANLFYLAGRKACPVVTVKDMPYRAAVILNS